MTTPPIEVLDWPDPPLALPLELARLPEAREEMLRGWLPAPQPSAWATARSLLHWVRRQWRHANTDTGYDDAVTILEGAAAGERFQCDQYAVVLAQGLNASGIPARWIGVRLADYHHGTGKAHSVVDAWIDDLAAWVLLDAQNGAYWAYDDRALSPLELQRIYRDGGPRPTMVGCEEEADFWWPYFDTVSVGEIRWTDGGFCPVFQDRFLMQTTRLMRQPDAAYPDLASVSIGIGGPRERPELLLASYHPYRCGYRVNGDLVDERWALDLAPGEHHAPIGVVTAYGELAAGGVTYRVA